MIKIYQTIIDKGHGNCMQAAIASLLDLQLEEVPNFIEYEVPYFELLNFLKTKNIEPNILDIHFNIQNELRRTDLSLSDIKKVLNHDNGFNGYFYANVISKLYPHPGTHAVIINANLQIVHDVNPNEIYLDVTENDIVSVITCNNNWYIDTNNTVILYNN